MKATKLSEKIGHSYIIEFRPLLDRMENATHMPKVGQKIKVVDFPGMNKDDFNCELEILDSKYKILI